MSAQSTDIATLLGASPVLPVATLEQAETGVEYAHALLRGGIHCVEVTLRTAAALRVIEAIARAVPQIAVGAGTVLNADDLASAARAGARFAISPGATPSLYAAPAPIPWLPSVATASEVMVGLAAGHRTFKFFPAAAAGGVGLLNALRGPFPQARFCPTGGIGPTEAPAWLALPNVLCVGGSWLAPPDAIRERDWARIEALARDCAALRRPSAIPRASSA
jgi:2-dehydro-3-deoxyphosphogluconate aldolase / (4S)-4-hydroxy-2-oxoglutarate aldolase